MDTHVVVDQDEQTTADRGSSGPQPSLCSLDNWLCLPELEVYRPLQIERDKCQDDCDRCKGHAFSSSVCQLRL